MEQEPFCPPLGPEYLYQLWEVGDEGPEKMLFEGEYRECSNFSKTMSYYGSNLRFGETVLGIPLVAEGQISHVELRKKLDNRSYSDRQKEVGIK